MKKAILLIGFLLCIAITNAQTMKLWAVAQTGGANNWGTIINMNPDGTNFNTAWNFDFTFGGSPMGNLCYASDGNLYGTCYDGGTFGSCIIYRIDPLTYTFADIYDFDIMNGDYPRSGMVQSLNGKLYGAASSGGTSGAGVIYSMDPVTTVYTPEYSFDGTNGSTPYGSPILASDGKLYGATSFGGANGIGVIYCFDPSINIYTKLYDFDTINGSYPLGQLLQASNGIFYGMTSTGGVNGVGVIYSFDLNQANIFTKLHDFTSPSDGANPRGGLMQASNGLLYGMTYMGGASNTGTIFSFNISDNLLTRLFDFNNLDGASPVGELFQDANGMMYGTASGGGTNNNGVTFKFDLSNNTYTKLTDFYSTTTGNAPNGSFCLAPAPTFTGIENPNNPLNTVLIYPNPAKSIFRIGLANDLSGTTDFALSNVVGEKVIAWSEENTNAGYIKTVDVSELEKGFYFLTINYNGVQSVRKIAIQ